jgi:hypothetical protein
MLDCDNLGFSLDGLMRIGGARVHLAVSSIRDGSERLPGNLCRLPVFRQALDYLNWVSARRRRPMNVFPDTKAPRRLTPVR